MLVGNVSANSSTREPPSAEEVAEGLKETAERLHELTTREASGQITSAEAFFLVMFREYLAIVYPEQGPFDSPQKTLDLAKAYELTHPDARTQWWKDTVIREHR